MSYQIGILDQSPVFAEETPYEALQYSIELVQMAEKLGYKRFWVAEHHNMEQVAGVSPEVLIAHLLAKTDTIQIGSGGVMLQHYSPYKVAENFHVLANLAPNRVNVGIGKAPGGLQLSTQALQYDKVNDRADFEQRLRLLKGFLDQAIPKNHPLHGVQARPLPEEKLPLFLLGGSETSARLAKEVDAHYVFARFLNHADDVLAQIATWYQAHHPKRKFIVALAVLAAETKEHAQALAKEMKLYDISFADGKTLTVQAKKQLDALRNQTASPFTVDEREVPVITGTATSIKEQLDALHEQYGIDEFIIHTPLENRQARRESFQQIGEIYQKQSV